MTDHLDSGQSAAAAMSTAEIKRHITKMFDDNPDHDAPESPVAAL